MSRITEVLKKNGAKDIDGYVLVNNFGYRFTLGDRRYDARFWANCYGVYVGKWEIDKAYQENEPQMPENKPLLKKITDELNEIGEEF